jgi:hypothetical protein
MGADARHRHRLRNRDIRIKIHHSASRRRFPFGAYVETLLMNNRTKNTVHRMDHGTCHVTGKTHGGYTTTQRTSELNGNSNYPNLTHDEC